MANEFTLVEFSKIATDPLQKGVIDALLMDIPIMEMIPWQTIGALSVGITRLGTLPNVGFRKINEGFVVSTGSLEQRIESIALMGADFDTDKALVRASTTGPTARAVTQVMMLKAMAYKFNDKFINGNPESDPEEFKGLKERVNDLVDEGYTGQYINNAGTQGDGILLDDDEFYNFLNKLDELLYAIKGHRPDYLQMNGKMLLAMRAGLRKAKLLDTTKDMFDRVVDVYQNCRMVDIGTTADQTTEIITSTETLEADGGSESTSIYAMKFAMGQMLWGIQEYPLEVEDKGLLEDKPIYRTEVDWPLGLAMADPYCLSRLYGIIPDNST